MGSPARAPGLSWSSSSRRLSCSNCWNSRSSYARWAASSCSLICGWDCRTWRGLDRPPGPRAGRWARTRSPGQGGKRGLVTRSLRGCGGPSPPALPAEAAHAGPPAVSQAAPGPPGVSAEDPPHDPAPGSAASAPERTPRFPASVWTQEENRGRHGPGYPDRETQPG